MKDLQVEGGFTITSNQLQEQFDWAIKNRHAHCYIQVVSLLNHDDFPVCTILDLFTRDQPTKSITNDAEFVTRAAWVSAQSRVNFPSIPIIYRDTQGQWDELRHVEGNFTGFRLLREEDKDEAMELAYKYWLQDNHLAADN